MSDETPTPSASGNGSPQRLQKQLRLIDVFAISTGAMFSSGFFLLPGLASAEAGPAVALAYLLAGVLILPAMLSAAELSTAMPRAGGPYYFLDRSIGPLFGTVAGIGTWLGLVFKSAFALVGMSAYIGLFFDLPIQPVAIGLTVVFTCLNIVGVKKTTRLQIGLVALLLLVLGYFLVAGFVNLAMSDATTIRDQFTPFLPFGIESIIATTGLVFVSYAGLTQVASVSEEVKNPNRNIPLGMILSLVTATTIYVAGVFIMLAVLEPTALREDLTPVATAAGEFMPTTIGLVAIVAAAVAAFASTGNAGILSAARYPLAMARDRLLWHPLSKLGRFETPTSAILATGGIMVVFIATLDVRGIAGLASAFMLLIFGLMNLAVIVMRESRIQAYDPGFRSPLYPWVQLAGIVITIVLIFEIGPLEAIFTSLLTVASVTYYFTYARHRVSRDGAIYHIFERLGRRRDQGLDRELLGILQEQGLRDEDRFAEVVARAKVVELPDGASYEDAVAEASRQLRDRLDIDEQDLADRFQGGSEFAASPVAQGAALPHVLLSGVDRPEMVVVRSRSGVPHPAQDGQGIVYALLFLVGAKERAGQMLRILAQVAAHVDNDAFLRQWNVARNEQELKEVLLAEEQFLSLRVRADSETSTFIGAALRDVSLPEGVLVALVRRDGRTIVPRGSTVLRDEDRITVIGDPEAIHQLQERYGPTTV
jgi:basic amino acid/polyamine antiporter, APA family